MHDIMQDARALQNRSGASYCMLSFADTAGASLYILLIDHTHVSSDRQSAQCYHIISHMRAVSCKKGTDNAFFVSYCDWVL